VTRDEIEAPVPAGEPPAEELADVELRYPALRKFRDRLGDTPLMRVPGPAGHAEVLAKCEWHNPVGSIKDRVAYALVREALRRHGDRPLEELRLLEYSGGNLAGALAELGSELGLRTRVVLSSASAPSLLAMLRARDTQVDLVPKDLGFLEVMRTALRIAESEPGWSLLYQHRNPANPAFHRDTTGAELVAQLAGRSPAVWLASIGTGGTLIGVLRALREAYPEVRAVGVTPAELPYGSPQPPNGRPKYGGSGGLGNGIRQPFVAPHDSSIQHRTVSYPAALAGMAEFLDLTGVRIGSSAAANWLVAREIAATLPAGATVVTVFADAGTPEEWERLAR
jgi:cysteine synthase A